MDAQYRALVIEKEAQEFWAEQQCFRVSEDPQKTKFYCLAMFPYPSGRLHMGHVRNYTIGDVISRYQRMLGKNVLQPMGWDAFGLPAENAAIKNQMSAAAWTSNNIATMRQQLQQLGFAYDWQREITTCHPDYYRWEQWFFLEMYKHGLVYKKNAEVNWDPVDQTVLANEQVIDGRGWRSGALVERKEVAQWFLKITHYADALLQGLDSLAGWPAQVKTMQSNWLGRSAGVEVSFAVPDLDTVLTVFTTRVDTLYGVSYLAIAPQHPLAQTIAATNHQVAAFLQECRNIKVAEATIATMPKQGIDLAVTAKHPLSGQDLPIWVTNFVLMSYGTGAVMAVPAHDERDFIFAKNYNLACKPVVMPADKTWDFTTAAFTADGVLVNSAEFSGLSSPAARVAIMNLLTQTGQGQRKVNYRLRDWSISRQRYWGTPVPIINCDFCGTVPAPLPVLLPQQLCNTGNLNLATMPEFYQVSCPQCQQPARRETDTFDTFFESAWYYARYACPQQNAVMLDSRVNYWLPVDQYIGGIEHAVLHLLYARFINKVLCDLRLLTNPEPFTNLLTQGLVLYNGVKMSKSKGNVIDPQDLIELYGADTVRLFIIFAAPPEQSLEWSAAGVDGSARFIKRLWTFAYQYHQAIQAANKLGQDILTSTAGQDGASKSQQLSNKIYAILAQINYDYNRQQFNTVVSGCMKILNILNAAVADIGDCLVIEESVTLSHCLSILLRCLAPIIPHVTHKLWQCLHYPGIIVDAPWPQAAMLNVAVEHITIVVQINGKMRTSIAVAATATNDDIAALALAEPKVHALLANQQIKKFIFVPHKVINIVTTVQK